MLVLTRRVGERVIIEIESADDQSARRVISVVVTAVRGGAVRFGIVAPRAVKILRAELRAALGAQPASDCTRLGSGQSQD